MSQAKAYHKGTDPWWVGGLVGRSVGRLNGRSVVGWVDTSHISHTFRHVPHNDTCALMQPLGSGGERVGTGGEGSSTATRAMGHEEALCQWLWRRRRRGISRKREAHVAKVHELDKGRQERLDWTRM